MTDTEHRSHRATWVRSAVLGANDGIVSVAAIIAGVAAAGQGRSAVAAAGLAGLVAGSGSIAAAEYVSSSSQADAQNADLERERRQLQANPVGERAELAGIYRERGLSDDLAEEVAEELHEKRDPLDVHAREELELTHRSQTQPKRGAGTAAGSFLAGGMLPLGAVLIAPAAVRIEVTIVAAAAALGLNGWVGARLGGAPALRGVIRVVACGLAAMLLTMAIGTFGGRL
jgi:VIT1/CCC1 family predicted Fe2+/Mn2+ transporter